LAACGASLAADDIDAMVRHVRTLCDSAELRLSISNAAAAAIDGMGAERVAAAIEAMCLASAGVRA
jgi:hypothetical protein